MGLFGAIKGIGKKLIGGGGGGSYSGYRSPYTGSYEDQTRSALSNALGGVSKDAKGNYNFGEGFRNLSGSAGKDYATQGYDFSGMDDAINSYKTSSYKPQTFTFGNADNIDAMTDLEYGMGSKNINRAGNNSLTKIQEATGTRRPGLLMKAASQNQRDVGEQLAALNSNLRSTALGQKTQLGKEQQMAQEQQAQYQAQNELARNRALAEAIQNKISTQSGLTENERQNQMILMNYLKSLFADTAGLTNTSAQIAGKNRSDVIGSLGSLAGGIGSIASAIPGI